MYVQIKLYVNLRAIRLIPIWVILIVFLLTIFSSCILEEQPRSGLNLLTLKAGLQPGDNPFC